MYAATAGLLEVTVKLPRLLALSGVTMGLALSVRNASPLVESGLRPCSRMVLPSAAYPIWMLVAATGVDQIAVGWLTHSARVLDIGLDA